MKIILLICCLFSFFSCKSYNLPEGEWKNDDASIQVIIIDDYLFNFWLQKNESSFQKGYSVEKILSQEESTLQTKVITGYAITKDDNGKTGGYLTTSKNKYVLLKNKKTLVIKSVNEETFKFNFHKSVSDKPSLILKKLQDEYFGEYNLKSVTLD